SRARGRRLAVPADPGPERSLDPEVGFVAVPPDPATAGRAVADVLAAARATGIGSFEIVAAARDPETLEALRALSLRARALRYCPEVAPDDGSAWRDALKAARGRRLVAVRPGAFEARFLTEALERLENDADLVAGERGRRGSRDVRTRRERIGQRIAARLARGARLRDPLASFAVRNDDRLQAELRALGPGRGALPRLLARLRESGARIREIGVDAG
ncbi:MAG TPA: hypothetical protein VKE69_08210, partial [Planctomycetota bacterium]|nr:hypothetical protein [Planctomycetota bacterium]